MIAKLVDGFPVPCPKTGKDGRGIPHTNLPLYYERNLERAAMDGYYPVHYTEKPIGDFVETWELIDGEIVQVWVPYSPQPEPIPVNVEKLRADVDYIAMMEDIDLDGDLL